MQIAIPAADLPNDSFTASSSSRPTAPSCPCILGDYNSAPTSSTHSFPAVYRKFDDDFLVHNSSPSYKKNENCISVDADFEFSCSLLLDKTELVSADELFDGGKIRLLKPSLSCRSNSKSIPPSHSTSTLQEKHCVRIADEMRNNRAKQSSLYHHGREKKKISYSYSSHKETRTFSASRVSDTMSEEDEIVPNQETSYSQELDAPSALSSSKRHKQWKLKNLLLFRSASEGRASIKSTDLINRVSQRKEVMEDIHNFPFRSVDGKVSKMREFISAHEKHYSMNRVLAEEMKRKTMLPYRQGLFGCLGF